MSALVSDCIEGWDVEGEGETIDDAFLKIAEQCDQTARQLQVDSQALTAAAERFRLMREVPR
jgi:hypothetical protein